MPLLLPIFSKKKWKLETQGKNSKLKGKPQNSRKKLNLSKDYPSPELLSDVKKACTNHSFFGTAFINGVTLKFCIYREMSDSFDESKGYLLIEPGYLHKVFKQLN